MRWALALASGLLGDAPCSVWRSPWVSLQSGSNPAPRWGPRGCRTIPPCPGEPVCAAHPGRWRAVARLARARPRCCRRSPMSRNCQAAAAAAHAKRLGCPTQHRGLPSEPRRQRARSPSPLDGPAPGQHSLAGAGRWGCEVVTRATHTRARPSDTLVCTRTALQLRVAPTRSACLAPNDEKSKSDDGIITHFARGTQMRVARHRMPRKSGEM